MEPLRIVIADDEPIIRLDLRRTLENMGHIVIGEAGDGAQAVEVTRELKPDVAILDVKMPNMDGIDRGNCAGSSAYGVLPEGPCGACARRRRVRLSG